MIIIEVEDVVTKERNGVKDGKPWSMRFQQIIMTGHSVDGFPARHPRETSIQIQKDALPFAVGKYAIAPESYYFGDFDKLTFRLKLQPLAEFLAALQKQVKPA